MRNNIEKQYNSPAYVEVPYVSPSGVSFVKQFLRRRSKEIDISQEEAAIREEIREKQRAERAALIRQRRKELEGIMSEHSRKKMLRAIQWLELSASRKKVWQPDSKKYVKFKLNFITLTLPTSQQESDNEIKHKCLNSLLTELRKFHGVKNYIWRAEKQANGNIHFHLVTDSFIDHTALRRRWNRVINVLGYVDRYSEKMRSNIKSFSDYYNAYINQGSYIQLMRRYNAGKANNWTNPNTTDVHSTKKVKNIIAYLAKYMSKNIEEPELLTPDMREQLLVSGRIWGLSESLSNLNSIEIPVSYDYGKELYDLTMMTKGYTVKDDFFVFFSIPIQNIYRNNFPLLQAFISNVIRERLNPVFDTIQ